MVREIPSYIKVSNRKIYYFYITTRDDRKIIERIIKYLESYNIDLLHGLMNAHVVNNTRNIGFFVDFTEARVSLKESIEYIKKISGVINVEYSEAIEDKIVYADIGFPLTTSGGKERVVVFSESWLSLLMNHIYNKFSTVGLVFLYESGRGIGLKVGKEYRKIFSTFEKGFIALLKLMKSYGLADPTNVSISPNNIIVSLRDDFESNVFYEKIKEGELLNNFNRGLLEGFIEGFKGERYSSKLISFDKEKNILTITLSKKIKSIR